MPRGGARPGAGRKPGLESPAKRDLVELAKGKAAKALQILMHIAEDEHAPTSARVSAAIAVIERGYGRPAQAVQLSGSAAVPVHTINMTMTPQEAADMYQRTLSDQ